MFGVALFLCVLCGWFFAQSHREQITAPFLPSDAKVREQVFRAVEKQTAREFVVLN